MLISHLNAFIFIITLCGFWSFNFMRFFSIAKSKISLGKCHIAENMWVYFKYLLILISNIIPQWYEKQALYDFNTWPRNFCTLFNVHWLISVLHIYIHFYGAILHLHDLVKFCQFLQCSWLSSSCYTETTVDGDLKQQTLFLTVLEAGKFKVKALAEWWDPASWFLSATFSLFSSHGWEQRHEASFLVSQVTRTLTPFIRAPIPVQNSSQSPSSHYHIGS